MRPTLHRHKIASNTAPSTAHTVPSAIQIAASPQTVQQFEAINLKFDEAFNKHDATAVGVEIKKPLSVMDHGQGLLDVPKVYAAVNATTFDASAGANDDGNFVLVVQLTCGAKKSSELEHLYCDLNRPRWLYLTNDEGKKHRTVGAVGHGVSGRVLTMFVNVTKLKWMALVLSFWLLPNARRSSRPGSGLRGSAGRVSEPANC